MIDDCIACIYWWELNMFLADVLNVEVAQRYTQALCVGMPSLEIVGE